MSKTNLLSEGSELTVFSELNNFINELFFDGHHESAPIYLDVEEREEQALAEFLSIDRDELDQYIGMIVVETLTFDKGNAYSLHTAVLKEWRKNNFDTPPPFTALLLAFSLAAERMRKGERYSASNYYQRLFELFAITDESQQRKLRFSGKHTEPFWKALNLWLTEYDYAYGRPTAKQVNKWKYVSYALSQSLVRDGDRKRFHRMFTDFGLSPHDNVSESEMTLFLHEWIGTSGPSAWLKRLWSSDDLRPRVAGAAVQELEVWNGSDDRGIEARSSFKRLGWTVVFRTFPKKQAKFYLATSEDSTVSGRLCLSERSSEVVRRAHKEVGDYWFSELAGTGLMALEPIAKLRLSAFFLGAVELEDPSSSSTYRHEATPITVFSKDESGQYFREVSRVSLHSKHMVLCHENWLSEVEAHLQSNALSGFSCIKGDNANGVPVEWCLIRDVEFVVLPADQVPDKLQSLMPLSVGATIHFAEGLKLAHNIWHASAPPEVLASSDDGLLDAQLRADDLNADGQIISETISAGFDPDFVYKVRKELNSQNLRVLGLQDGKVVAERDISFRTALTPRRAAHAHDASYAYPLEAQDSILWGVSAVSTIELASDAIALEGMKIFGDLPPVEMAQPASDLTIKVTYDEEESDAGFVMGSVEGGAETCTLRRYHYYVCPPFLGGDKGSVSRIMECKDCKELKIAVKTKRGRRRSRSQYRPMAARKRSAVNIAGQVEHRVSADSAFDAICYLGSGTANSLDSILGNIVSAPWEVSIATANLVDLGHIDVSLGESLRRPKHWSCAPPTMVITGNGTAFLAGFRNASVVKNVMAVMKELSSRYKLKKQDKAPIAHAWEVSRTGATELRERLAAVTDPNGRQIEVVENPGAGIISQMPRLDEIRRSLKSIHIEDNGDIERFDPATGRWASSEINTQGAYRTTFCGRRYFYVDANRQMIEAGVELAKVFAARDAGLRLHGYDESSGAFECVVGCQPPGILRRALVSFSGRLPELNDNGRHIYKSVPRDVACLLLNKLYQ